MAASRGIFFGLVVLALLAFAYCAEEKDRRMKLAAKLQPKFMSNRINQADDTSEDVSKMEKAFDDGSGDDGEKAGTDGDDALKECNAGDTGVEMKKVKGDSSIIRHCSDLESSWDISNTVKNPYLTCACMACGGKVVEDGSGKNTCDKGGKGDKPVKSDEKETPVKSDGQETPNIAKPHPAPEKSKDVTPERKDGSSTEKSDEKETQEDAKAPDSHEPEAGRVPLAPTVTQENIDEGGTKEKEKEEKEKGSSGGKSSVDDFASEDDSSPKQDDSSDNHKSGASEAVDDSAGDGREQKDPVKEAALRECYDGPQGAFIRDRPGLSNQKIDSCSQMPRTYKKGKLTTKYNDCACEACGYKPTDHAKKESKRLCEGVPEVAKKKMMSPAHTAANAELNECNTGAVGKSLLKANLGKSHMKYECADIEAKWKASSTVVGPYNKCACLACKGTLEDDGKCIKADYVRGDQLMPDGETKTSPANALQKKRSLPQCQEKKYFKLMKMRGLQDRKVDECTQLYKTWVWKKFNSKGTTTKTCLYNRCVCKACNGTIKEDENNQEVCEGHEWGIDGVYRIPPPPPKKKSAWGKTKTNAYVPPEPKCSFDKYLIKLMKNERTQAQIMSSQGFVNNFVKRKEAKELYPAADSMPPEMMKAIKDDQSIYYFAFKYAKSINRLRKKLLRVQLSSNFTGERRCEHLRNYLLTTALRHLAVMFVDTRPEYRSDTEGHRYSDKPVYTLANSVKSYAQNINANGGDWEALSMAVRRAHMIAVHEVTVWAAIYMYLSHLENENYNDEMLERVQKSAWLMYLPYSTLWTEDEIEEVENKLENKSGYAITDGINFGNEELAKKVGLTLDTTDLAQEREKLERELDKLANFKTADKTEVAIRQRQIVTQMKAVDSVSKTLTAANLEVSKVQKSTERKIQDDVQRLEKLEHKQIEADVKSASEYAKETIDAAVQAMPAKDGAQAFSPDLARIRERKLNAVEEMNGMNEPDDQKYTLTRAIKRQNEEEKKHREELRDAIERQAEMANPVMLLLQEDTAKGGEPDVPLDGDGESDDELRAEKTVEEEEERLKESEPSAKPTLEDASDSPDDDSVDSSTSDPDQTEEDLGKESETDGMERLQHSMLVKARRLYEEKMSELDAEMQGLDIATTGELDMFGQMMEGRCHDFVEKLINRTNEELASAEDDIQFRLGLTVEDATQFTKDAFLHMKSKFESKAEDALAAHHTLYGRLLENEELRYTDVNGDYQTKFRDEAVTYMGKQLESLEKVRRVLARAIHEAADIVTDYLSEENDSGGTSAGESFWNKWYLHCSDEEEKETMAAHREKQTRRNEVVLSTKEVSERKYSTFIFQPRVTPTEIFVRLNNVRCPIGFGRYVVVVVTKLIDALENIYKEAVRAGIEEIPKDLPNRPTRKRDDVNVERVTARVKNVHAITSLAMNKDMLAKLASAKDDDKGPAADDAGVGGDGDAKDGDTLLDDDKLVDDTADDQGKKGSKDGSGSDGIAADVTAKMEELSAQGDTKGLQKLKSSLDSLVAQLEETKTHPRPSPARQLRASHIRAAHSEK